MWLKMISLDIKFLFRTWSASPRTPLSNLVSVTQADTIMTNRNFWNRLMVQLGYTWQIWKGGAGGRSLDFVKLEPTFLPKVDLCTFGYIVMTHDTENLKFSMDPQKMFCLCLCTNKTLSKITNTILSYRFARKHHDMPCLPYIAQRRSMADSTPRRGTTFGAKDKPWKFWNGSSSDEPSTVKGIYWHAARGV